MQASTKSRLQKYIKGAYKFVGLIGRRTNMNRPNDIFELAQRHYQTGNWPEAERLFRHLLELDVNNVEAHSKLATALYQQGNFREAVIAYQQVLRFKPHDPYASYNLGLATRIVSAGSATQSTITGRRRKLNCLIWCWRGATWAACIQSH